MAIARAEIGRATTDRDQALARLRAIEEARPILRLEPLVGPVPDVDGRMLRCGVKLWVVNDRDDVLVMSPYAEIAEWAPLLGGRWNVDALRAMDALPAVQVAQLPRDAALAGNFHGSTEFLVAGYDPDDGQLAHFLVDRSVLLGCTFPPGEYGVRIRVGVANHRVRPIVGWFKLTFVGGHDPFIFEAWDGPSS